VGTDPLRQFLGPRGFSVSVVASRKYGNKNLRFPDLPRPGVFHRHRLASVVNHHPLAGAVVLSQHHVQLAAPLAVALAELAVLQTFGVLLLVLLPEQLQGDPFTPHFLVNPHHIWLRPLPGQA